MDRQVNINTENVNILYKLSPSILNRMTAIPKPQTVCAYLETSVKACVTVSLFADKPLTGVIAQCDRQFGFVRFPAVGAFAPSWVGVTESIDGAARCLSK